MRSILVGISSLLVLGCGSSTGADDVVGRSSAPLSGGFCAHVAPGAPASGDPTLALSRAHAAFRFFGPHATLVEVDRALSHALANPIGDRTLNDYVQALGDGQECALPASSRTLGPASVRLVGDVAVVKPGTGTLTLPAGAKAVAIDVRDVPNVVYDLVSGNVDAARAALDAAASLALATPINRPVLSGRVWNDMANSDAQWGDVGFAQFATVLGQLEPMPGGAPADLPLAIITGGQLAPAAAELALTLRAANRAYIFGDDVYTAVAESMWNAVGDSGLAWREFDLSDENTGARLPDVFPADAKGSDVATLVRGLSSRGAPPPFVPGPVTRPTIDTIADLFAPADTTLGVGEARAALVTAHGALRLYDLNFEDLGDDIDARLAETLLEVDVLARRGSAIDRALYQDVLRRFGNALNDGHNFVGDEARPFTGFIPLKLEQIDGEPVVRRSEVPGIEPGDAIEAIDGLPQQLYYAAQTPITSASKDSYRWNQITRKRLLRVYGPRTFLVRSPDGRTRQVVAQPKPFAYEVTFGTGPIDRPSGFLTDLGAPDVFYLNMAYEVTPDEQAGVAAVTRGAGARAMVVDMRGYPHGDHYAVDAALIPQPFFSPTFTDAFELTGIPGDRFVFAGSGPVDFEGPTLYTGPLVLLVGTDTASAAENFATMLVDAHRPLHVVGRATAGTNGTITGLELPGHFSFDFTGQNVKHADGSKYLGIGIVPDVPVALTAQSVAGGQDPELAAALALLHP